MLWPDTKKIRQAFEEFNHSIERIGRSSDPWVRLIIDFIQKLGKAF